MNSLTSVMKILHRQKNLHGKFAEKNKKYCAMLQTFLEKKGFLAFDLYI